MSTLNEILEFREYLSDEDVQVLENALSKAQEFQAITNDAALGFPSEREFFMKRIAEDRLFQCVLKDLYTQFD